MKRILLICAIVGQGMGLCGVEVPGAPPAETEALPVNPAETPAPPPLPCVPETPLAPRIPTQKQIPVQGFIPETEWPPTPNALQDKGNLMIRPQPQINPSESS